VNRIGNFYDEDQWLEHLEEKVGREMRLSLNEDMAEILKNSPADRKLYEKLKRTRELVKEADPVFLTENGQYYDQLHAKIMSNLEQESLRRSSDKKEKPKKGKSRKGASAFSSSVILALMTGIIASLSYLSIVPIAMMTAVHPVRQPAAFERVKNQRQRPVSKLKVSHRRSSSRYKKVIAAD
jgi:hypothetical protein